MEPIIKVKSVNFTYNKGRDNEFQALININCDIYPEEFIIVFGPSGCGKSTLLNIIAGLEMPQSGDITVLNQDLKRMTKRQFAMYHRAQVGMIYQQYNLITSLNVLDNVALPQIFVNVRKYKREKWALKLLERFGILKQARKIPTELSGGQQQRIGIARAIVNNPQIVLADEPVGNLDSVSAKNVLEILEELNEKEKKTVILVTHNPEFLSYGDRIFYMKDGIITREVVNREKHKKEEKKVQKTAAAEINDLMRAYHGLSPEQINILIMPYKAKAFAHHFISSRNMEETKTLEEIIQRRLLGTIPQEDFFEVLHKSSEEGGVGFDIRTAEKILRRVNRIIRTAYYIYQESRQRTDDQGRHIAISDEEKASKVTWYLLKTCYNKHYKNLDEVQVNRLRQAVKDRLTGALQKKDFYKVLDRPFKDNGVGLNRKTARAMSEELELILILGFGIVQKVSSAESRAAEKDIKKNIQNIRKSITADMPGAGLPPSGQASGFQPPPPPTAAVPAGQESKAEETAGSGSEPAGTAETEAPAAPDRQKEAGETTQEQAERVERMLKQALESHVANSQDGQAAGADQAGREEGGEEAAVAAGSGRGENIEKQE